MGTAAVTRPRSAGRGDRGFATVWAATAIAVLIGVLVAMLNVAAAVGARHRAESAADLAALAAAGQAVRGATVACARAAEMAARTGGRLALCRVDGEDAVVEVEAHVALTMLGVVTVHGRARAGPVEAGPRTRDPPVNPSPH